MSDTFAGLTRRVNNLVHEQETAEELSYLVDEAKEVGGDAADAIIELALGEEHIECDAYDDNDDDDDEMSVVVEDDDYVDDEDTDEDDSTGDESDEDIDAELDSLEDDVDEDDDDTDLYEATKLTNEVFFL